MKIQNQNESKIQHPQLFGLQTRIEELEAALGRSLFNQRTLQENVTFLLDVESNLRMQLEESEQTQKSKISQLSKDLDKKSQQSECLRRKVEQLTELLHESKQALEGRQSQLTEKDGAIRRLQALLREQKKTIESLESEKLYNNLSFSQNRGKQPNQPKEDIAIELYELQERYQKQIIELEYQLKRGEQALQNEQTNRQRLEKENYDFRRWLNKMVGVDRMVPGCQKVIMREIQKRLASQQ